VATEPLRWLFQLRHLLFVIDTRSTDVAVVRTASRSLFTLLPTGRTQSIAVKASSYREFCTKSA